MEVTWLMRASRMAADSQRFLCFTDTLPSSRHRMRGPSQRVGYASGASRVVQRDAKVKFSALFKRESSLLESKNLPLRQLCARLYEPNVGHQGSSVDHPLLVDSLHTMFNIVHTMEKLHHLVLQLMANVQ